MEQVAFATMGKKDKYIRIRADEELKTALWKAAQRDVRSESDEARYLLLKALGLLAAEEDALYESRGSPSQKKQGRR